MKNLFFAVVTGLSLMLPSFASAETITEWVGNPIVVGDKTFTLIDGSSLPSDLQVTISNIGLFWAVDVGFNGLFDTEGTYTLSYSVTITGTNEFLSAGLDSTVVGSVTVSEAITPGPTLVSTDGSADVGAIGGQFIAVVNTIEIGSGSAISGFANSFTQVLTVPEPSTLALLGLGGLGFAVHAMRRRQAV